MKNRRLLQTLVLGAGIAVIGLVPSLAAAGETFSGERVTVSSDK